MKKKKIPAHQHGFLITYYNTCMPYKEIISKLKPHSVDIAILTIAC